MTKQLQFYSDLKSSVQDVVEHLRGNLGSGFSRFPRPDVNARLSSEISCLDCCQNLYLLLIIMYMQVA